MHATVMFGTIITPLYSMTILSLYKHMTVAIPNPTVMLTGRSSEPVAGETQKSKGTHK